ncbi:MAG: hypothetical protein NZ736_04190 [Candidatus Poseidoniaceae archaeon]|nr:hypothetical protein [Candidatus Poseidoniaceae archaeon]
MELLDSETWEDFFSAPIAMLMLGKNDCASCETWTVELEEFVVPEGVRIGKILLDTPGLGRFKIAHDWVSGVDVLPFNVIFVNGEMKKQWAGGGIERMQNRLSRFL